MIPATGILNFATAIAISLLYPNWFFFCHTRGQAAEALLGAGLMGGHPSSWFFGLEAGSDKVVLRLSDASSRHSTVSLQLST